MTDEAESVFEQGKVFQRRSRKKESREWNEKTKIE